MRRESVGLLVFALSPGFASACDSFYYTPDTAARHVMPDALRNTIEAREAEDIVAVRRDDHVALGPAFAAYRQLAQEHADAAALRGRVEARRRAMGDDGALRPPLSEDDVTAALATAGIVPSEELVALYATADGQDGCEDAAPPPFVLDHCLLSLDAALALREADRELFIGVPDAWLPLLSSGPDRLYVMASSEPERASPVLQVSLLRSSDRVVFSNLLAMVETAEAWSAERLWPPDDLDAASVARFRDIYRHHNPSVSIDGDIPWSP